MWLSTLLIGLIKLLIGALPRWIGCKPESVQRIYFANHSSHMDTLALWSALPANLRKTTRPVAAADYWNNGTVRRYVALKALNAVLIQRQREERTCNPLEPLVAALNQGYSLILFPEGTRNSDREPGPFKAGLYHLAQQFPGVELIPVYLDNLHRSMPKGSKIPVPLVCSVRFGSPLMSVAGEARDAFLERARAAIVELS